MDAVEFPRVIQGGMGVAVSNWRLARAVSQYGQLGVVSGTFLDSVMVRRLQDGDVDGSIHRALCRFPDQDMASRVLERYFLPDGRGAKSYQLVTMHSANDPAGLLELTVVANFVEVFLAKEGHCGLVGVNYLMKIDLPTLASLYGAMLAGVDFVLMGAGIPKMIPGILDKLSMHEDVSLKIDVESTTSGEPVEINFSPASFWSSEECAPLKRPKFLAIVSSSTLAQTLARKANGRVDGFVVEHHSAGGHNAPPRGGINVDANGEPIYGTKDECNPEDFTRIGLPFWWAGSCASPEMLNWALSCGAQGIQVGTAFAYCNESGIRQDIKESVIDSVRSGTTNVFTDPLASASGYPFKIVDVDGSLSDPAISAARPRICDLGYLRTGYLRDDGSVGFRCPAEPVEDYVKKGGKREDTIGRKCLCNGLMSTVGYAQVQKDGYVEPPLVTAGKELKDIGRFLKPGERSYSAADVLCVLLSEQPCVLSRDEVTSG